ncbi:MAG TPA: pantoate--beta-alanine ligase [Patescibacteria group bacterium]|nr:pantoate--beta-alanine ligase [Patescibacteria group bacterium]
MRLETITDPARMKERSREVRHGGMKVGLVPTMGYLHDGHLSLMRRARRDCGWVVASIFVNPSQFGPGEDFEHYPRDLERDREMLERAEVDALFHPEPAAIYPRDPGGRSNYHTWITVEGLSDVLCGAARPGHFRGVATVVAKLLNIVEPDIAYFGQKDAQQAIIIRTMARDLNLAPRIEICPTVREADGLAMSSRNKYLSPAERDAAPVIHRALSAAMEAVAAGERSPRAVIERARIVLAGEPLFKLEYIELVDSNDLRPITNDRLAGEALLAAAGRIGNTRLIDNMVVAVKV